MIPTTETYNPYSIIRNVDIQIQFNASNPEALNKSNFISDYSENISDFNQLKRSEYTQKKFATCESNFTLLNGESEFLPETIDYETQQIGWWSNSISDENGDFEEYPTLNVSISDSVSCVGFTLYSAIGNEISEAIISTYLNTTEIYTETFISNSNVLIADLPVSNFNKVVIQITKTKYPNRRVKLESFIFGIIKNWNRDSIVSASVEESTSVIGDALPIKKFTVEFDNSDGDFDINSSTKKYVYKNAMKTANISSTSASEISDFEQLSDELKKGYKFATCENNMTLLDGNSDFLSSKKQNNIQLGYVSLDLSGENCDFINTPNILYTWNKKLKFDGLKLFFDEYSYATSITVISYENDIEIDRATFENDSNECILDFSVADCNKLVIEFNSSYRPHSFIKLNELQILKYADSWTSYLTTDNPISAKFIVNGEEIFMGDKYYFESISLKNGGLTAEITSHDYVYNLDNQTYTDGSDTNNYASVLSSNILSGSGINVDYIGTSMLVKNTTPKDTTKRAVLHYLAQASNKTCWLDRNNVFKIKELSIETPKDTFNSDNLYSMDISRIEDYVNMIRLTVKNEYVDPQTEQTYYGGSGLYYREIENNCVHQNNGNSVAEWLLSQKKRRQHFEMECRGNPALEIGDTIKIIDKNGTSYLAVIYEQTFEYKGALKSTVKAIAGEY